MPSNDELMSACDDILRWRNGIHETAGSIPSASILLAEHVKSTLASDHGVEQAIDEKVKRFANVLREHWSFSDQQQHTHTWHSREDFICRRLPKLLVELR